MRMLVSSVVVEVDEIFNVVMRTYKFNILERGKQDQFTVCVLCE